MNIKVLLVWASRSCRHMGLHIAALQWAKTCPSLRIATCSQTCTPPKLQAERLAKRLRSE